MDYNKIRSMTDEELSVLLKQLSARGSKTCIKCNKQSTFIVKVENTKTFQTKKLCGLCDDCYQDLLQSFDLFDVDWNDD